MRIDRHEARRGAPLLPAADRAGGLPLPLQRWVATRNTRLPPHLPIKKPEIAEAAATGKSTRRPGMFGMIGRE
jgi:hypothetical protein